MLIINKFLCSQSPLKHTQNDDDKLKISEINDKQRIFAMIIMVSIACFSRLSIQFTDQKNTCDEKSPNENIVQTHTHDEL